MQILQTKFNVSKYATEKENWKKFFSSYEGENGGVYELPLSIIIMDKPEEIKKKDGTSVISQTGSRLMKVGFIAINNGKDGEKIYPCSDVVQWVKKEGKQESEGEEDINPEDIPF